MLLIGVDAIVDELKQRKAQCQCCMQEQSTVGGGPSTTRGRRKKKVARLWFLLEPEANWWFDGWTRWSTP